MLVGVILVVAGGLRLGVLATLLSNPGLLGYQAGLGVIVIINQIHRLFGIQVSESDPLPRAARIVAPPDIARLLDRYGLGATLLLDTAPSGRALEPSVSEFGAR